MITDISINVFYKKPKYEAVRDAGLAFWYQDIRPPNIYWGAHVDHSQMIWFGDHKLPWVDVPHEEPEMKIVRVLVRSGAPRCCSLLPPHILQRHISEVQSVRHTLASLKVWCPHRPGELWAWEADVEVEWC
jgi:hypothetical protein